MYGFQYTTLRILNVSAELVQVCKIVKSRSQRHDSKTSLELRHQDISHSRETDTPTESVYKCTKH
jgi:hypothetical protein